MARKGKILVDKNGIDKRKEGYYSTPSYIAKYISERMLEIKPNGKFALDPAVGKEELLDYLYEKGIKIDGFDINNFGNYNKCKFLNINFIDYFIEKKGLNKMIELNYDYIIANPPYNCHEIDYINNNKKKLKKAYGTVGTHNMYSMFMYSIIDLAKEGSIIGLIISDSFLTAKVHQGLRNEILSKCSIHDLILCPTSLFHKQKADVRTCIIVLQKGRQFQKNIRVLDRMNEDNFKNILGNKNFENKDLKSILLGNNNIFQFTIGANEKILSLFNKYSLLGETFDCITGISTGNDNKYLRKERSTEFSIPFYKNPGRNKFNCQPDNYLITNFLEISLGIKDFMVRNKNYLFKEGITCSSMGLSFSACYLPEGSTYGVNANIFCKNRDDIYWLLSYLNSSLVTYIVRGILIRSNMITSGYVSKIPIINFSQEAKLRLTNISKEIISGKQNEISGIKEIDIIVFNEINLDKENIDNIINFSKNLGKRV